MTDISKIDMSRINGLEESINTMLSTKVNLDGSNYNGSGLEISVKSTLSKHIVVSDLPEVLDEDTFYYIAEE